MGDRQHPNVSVGDVRLGTRFLWRLPGFLRHPVTPGDALQTLRRRLEERGAVFLTLARENIYGQATSPYRQLLAVAGCEYGDLDRMVTQDGLEPTLRISSRHGVYLTVDEFKGRRPVVRGNSTIAVHPHQLQNPKARAHVPARSSGSGGSATPADVDLAFIRDLAVNHCLALNARGGAAWQHAIWSVPGSAALKRILWLAGFGAPPVRWFSPVDPAGQDLHPRYRWSAQAMHWVGALAGVSLPRPVHVPLADPDPIVRWLTEVLQAGRIPHLSTYASAAVRLCETAHAANVSLQGAQFTLSGEPITEVRLAAVLRVGVTAVPQYGASEAGGTIGHGCLAPAEADDIHLFDDLRAVVHPRGRLTPTCRRPPCCSPRSDPPRLTSCSTSLWATRRCSDGGTAGVLSSVSGGRHTSARSGSYEKLTSGGIRLFDSDVIGVLEKALPARFGGGPTDYQLVEDAGEDGQPRLHLVVDPAVGALDATVLADAFLSAIGAGSGAERVAGLLWRDSGLLRADVDAPRRVPEARFSTSSRVAARLSNRGRSGWSP